MLYNWRKVKMWLTLFSKRWWWDKLCDLLVLKRTCVTCSIAICFQPWNKQFELYFECSNKTGTVQTENLLTRKAASLWQAGSLMIIPIPLKAEKWKTFKVDVKSKWSKSESKWTLNLLFSTFRYYLFWTMPNPYPKTIFTPSLSYFYFALQIS